MNPLDGSWFNKTENTYATNFKERLGIAAIGHS